MPQSAIDETVLDQLGLLRRGNEDLAAKIVRLYLDTTPNSLTELQTAASAGDMDRVQIATHRLNSASTTVGAVHLAARCHELLRMLRIEQAVEVPDWVRLIVHEYNRVEVALRSWYAKRQAE